ncbi:hypothetical protein HY496_03170 [Candidatus Woesearchaeota archaeon]|nr:hypothetical protein [Candidatus Woesearchaeota archaeon]
MSNALKSLGIVIVISYSAIGCGPDSVNNFYGIKPTGRNGLFSCSDVGKVEQMCELDITGREDKFSSDSWSNCVGKACNIYDFGQNCIDCIISSPCVEQPKESGSPQTPWEICAAQGECPPQKKEWSKEICYD